MKKLACFNEPKFGQISLNISLSDSVKMRVLARPEMGLETIFESYRSKPVLTSSETVLRQLQSRLYQAACNTVPGCFRTLIGYLWNSATDSLSHLDCVW